MIFPPERETVEGGVSHGEVSEILEKPISKNEQVRRGDSLSEKLIKIRLDTSVDVDGWAEL